MVTEICNNRSLSDSWLQRDAGELWQGVISARPAHDSRDRNLRPHEKSSKSSWKSTINWEEKAGFIRSLLLSKTTLRDVLPPLRLHYLNLPRELHQLRTKYSRIWAFGVFLIQTATSLDSHRLMAVSWHNMHLVQLSKSLWSFTFSTLFKSPVCLLRFKAVS